MKFQSFRIRPWAKAMLCLILLEVHTSIAQTRLEDMTVESVGQGASRLTFTDPGSGATGYEIEYSFDLESGSWIVPDATLADLGGGRWQADLSGLDPLQGFLRVKLLGVGGDIRAYFDSADLVEAVEGSTATVTVRFSQPYSGPLRYRWTGTAAIDTPSGVVQVSGTSVQIQLTLADNATIDELAYLSLTLETAADTGYTFEDETDRSRFTLTVSDNDSTWIGSVTLDEIELDLQLQMVAQNGTSAVNLTGNGSSVFGEMGVVYEADMSTVGDSEFVAAFSNIPASVSGDNPQGADPSVDIELVADSVSASLIQGVATLTIDPGTEHLQTTITGRFTLARRPAAQSTTEVTFLR